MTLAIEEAILRNCLATGRGLSFLPFALGNQESPSILTYFIKSRWYRPLDGRTPMLQSTMNSESSRSTCLVTETQLPCWSMVSKQLSWIGTKGTIETNRREYISTAFLWTSTCADWREDLLIKKPRYCFTRNITPVSPPSSDCSRLVSRRWEI